MTMEFITDFGLIDETGMNPQPGPPVNTVAPAVTGPNNPPKVGDTLTATNGTWTGSPTSYTYQWYVDFGGGGITINFATNSTYVIEEGYIGGGLLCHVTAHNAGGSTEAYSNTTAEVIP